VRGADPGLAVARELALGVERLAPDAVPALVRREVEIVGVLAPDPLPQLPHDALVALAGRADEAVALLAVLPVLALHAERAPRLVEARRDLVDQLLRREAALGRGLLDLLAVLVGAGEEAGVVPAHPVEPGDRVAHHGGVRVAEVRDVVDVVDRRRDVERGHGSLVGSSGSPPASGSPPSSGLRGSSSTSSS
jgi:hypothetical protein